MKRSTDLGGVLCLLESIGWIWVSLAAAESLRFQLNKWALYGKLRWMLVFMTIIHCLWVY